MRTSIFIKQKTENEYHEKFFIYLCENCNIFTIFAYQQEESLDDMNKESVVRMA